LKITSFDKPKRVNTLSLLVLSDIHSTYIDQASFETALRFFLQTPKKRRRIVLLGDVLDFEAFVTKSETYQAAKKFKDFDGYFVPEVEKEWAWWEWFLAELMPLVSDYNDIWFFEGNHEERLRRPHFTKFMLHEYAYLFDLKKQLKIEERGINFIPYNDWVKISTASGDLMLTHGVYCGANPIKKHVDVARCSVMFGHTHERGVTSFKTVEGSFMGFNNPCLCTTQPRYMEGRPHNWSVGFSTIQITDEAFYVNQFTTHKGVLYDAHGRKI